MHMRSNSLLLLQSLFGIVTYDVIDAFSSFSSYITRDTSYITPRIHFAKPGDDGEEEDEDWRAFRAKLVMSESSFAKQAEEEVVVSDDDLDGIGALFQEKAKPELTISSPKFELPEGFTPLDPSQWAYDSGNIIEKGAIILGGAEQDFGFGLRQQYFHKAVILVLDHDENTFTKGIILNRPSEKMMSDDVNGKEWKVWFGGDVQVSVFSFIPLFFEYWRLIVVPITGVG